MELLTFWSENVCCAGGTDRAHLYSNGGTLQLHSGNLKLASGNGIDFSATGGPGSMTSELLDDYGRVTFTPTEPAFSGANLTTYYSGRSIYKNRQYNIQVSHYNILMEDLHLIDARYWFFWFTNKDWYGSFISNWSKMVLVITLAVLYTPFT